MDLRVTKDLMDLRELKVQMELMVMWEKTVLQVQRAARETKASPDKTVNKVHLERTILALTVRMVQMQLTEPRERMDRLEKLAPRESRV